MIKRRLRPIEIAMLIVPLCALAFASWRMGNAPEVVVPPRYTVRVLDMRLSVMGLNDSGDLFGFFSKGADGMELFATRKGQIQKLGLRDNCTPMAMNSTGDLVGDCSNKSAHRAFIWRNRKVENLKTFGGDNSYATGLNDKGEVIGRADTKFFDAAKQPVEQAFLWRNGLMQNLTPESESRSAAIKIDNDSTIVIGEAEGLSLWQNGEKNWVGDKENLGRYYNGTLLSDLNTASALWHKGKQIKFKPLPNTNGWFASDVNNYGFAVGAGNTSNDLSRFACVFIQGQMLDLNELVANSNSWKLQAAHFINNRGQIICEGKLNGELRFLLLTPQTPATSSTRTNE